MKKKKPLRRAEAYLAILRKINMKPAAKSAPGIAYMTTDHLRKLCEVLNAHSARPASGI